MCTAVASTWKCGHSSRQTCADVGAARRVAAVIEIVDPTQPFPDHEPVLARIGDVEITSTMVRTPTGQFPLRGSQWTITDQWTAEQKIPSWAIVSAIVGFCLVAMFSLLFLLAKETVYRGMVIVTVTNGAHHHACRVAVTSQQHVQQVYDQVNQARSLAAL